MPSQDPSPQQEAAVLDRLEEIAKILETGLDRETLKIVKALCEQGVNPQALAEVIKYLRREAAADS